MVHNRPKGFDEHLVFVLPPPLKQAETLGEGLERPIEVLGILPDGTERGGGDYAKSGKHLIEMCVQLLGEDLEKVVAFVVSRDNLNRGDAFLIRLRHAFRRFGLGVMTEKTLSKQAIALRYVGDLEEVRALGQHGHALVETLEAIQCLNVGQLRDGFKKELLLGINYAPEALNEEKVQLLIRSGMEANIGRFGSTAPSSEILVSAVEELFGDVSLEQVRSIIKTAKQHFRSGFEAGYSVDFLQALYEFESDLTDPERLCVQIPFTGGKAFIHGKIGAEAGCWIHVLEPFEERRFLVDSGTIVIAPDQSLSCFVVPSGLGYANVYPCDASPRAVWERICFALEEQGKYQTLHGAQRELPSSVALEDLSDYRTLKAALEEDFDWSEYAPYEAAAVGFAAAQLFEKQTLMPLKGSGEFRAAMNYALMSYFIAHDPLNPKREGSGIAEWVARYMNAIFTGDAAIYDRENSKDLRKITTYLQQGLQNQWAPLPMTPENQVVLAISKEWEAFLRHFNGKAHPHCLDRWKNALIQHYQCNFNEQDPLICKNPLIEEVQMEAEREAAVQAISSQYIKNARVPHGLREKLLRNLEQEDWAALELTMYLIDISGSIGAGLVYQTAALCMDPNEIHSDRLKALDEICFLSDLHNRMANDLAGVFRASGEDTNMNVYDIMKRHVRVSEGRSEALCDLERLGALKEEYEFLEGLFLERLNTMKETWPAMARIVERGRIGAEVYKESHPNDLSLKDMLGIYFTKVS